MDRDQKAIAACAQRFRRDPQTYIFVLDALDWTIASRTVKNPRQQCSAEEFAFGLKRFCVAQYGMLARSVLHYFGIYRSEDLGERIFELIEFSLIVKTADETRKDFRGVEVYDDAGFVPAYDHLLEQIEL